MSEENLVALFNTGLATAGVDDTVIVAGQFEPRGTSGGTAAGGMIGGSAGDSMGGMAGGIGFGIGVLVGRHAAGHGQGLPTEMMIGVSDRMVYGMHMRTRRKEPDELLFAVPRDGLTARVHQRVNVRVLELVDATGAAIELEGSRIPVTHSHDVLKVLTGTGEHAD